MTAPTLALLGQSIRTWFSAKGFWLVAVAALVPLVLTGSWVGSHRADLATSDLEYDESKLVEGQQVEFTSSVTNVGPTTVGPFNASVAVGSVSGGRLFAQANNEIRIESLAPGESRVLNLTWNATPGIFFAVATADPQVGIAARDEIGERDEFNNQKAKPIAVKYALPPASDTPTAPAGIVGESNNSTAESDLAIASLTPASGSLPAQSDQVFTARVENRGFTTIDNATVFVRVGRSFGDSFLPQQETSESFSLAPGESRDVALSWTTVEGAWWTQAYVQVGDGAFDPDASNNAIAIAYTVDPKLSDDVGVLDPPEQATIKEFYLNVLSALHLRFLIPLVALFYAGGTIADARENGSLAYVLTRPVPRWLLPLTKFLASFTVAAVATIVGLVLTYLLLFGTTPDGGDIGFLTTPIIMVLLALFVYGALFTLAGVWFERPYLIGIAFVLGWEIFAHTLLPWVRNLTITFHLSNAVSGMPIDQGLTWFPDSAIAPDSVRAFWVLLGAGVAMLAASAIVMKRREFAV